MLSFVVVRLLLLLLFFNVARRLFHFSPSLITFAGHPGGRSRFVSAPAARFKGRKLCALCVVCQLWRASQPTSQPTSQPACPMTTCWIRPDDLARSDEAR